ncbi:MAG: carbon-nitrogen hydrolase family protein [Pirellulales bacterium]
MTRRTVRIAMGQMLVQGGRPRENLQRATRMVASAAGCQIVVLPECLDLGWTHPTSRELAEPVPGPASDLLARAAVESGAHVVAGLTERADAALYNAAVLIAPDGQILLKHRKINVLDIEQDLYATGDRLQVVRTSFGVVGANICADNFPDSLALGHALGRMGAEILLSPSAWAVPADHDPRAEPYGSLWEGAYSTLARLYEMPVVGVSNVGPVTGGPWSDRKCIGCSLAVGSRGEVLAKGPTASRPRRACRSRSS